MSSFGVSLSFLLNEINQVELKSKSSVQIYDDFVKPKSLASGWSYVEYLESKEETKQYVKEANLFVSHRWQDCFYDILEAISRWIRMNGENIEDVVIWIDIFCQSHTYMTATPVDFDYWNQLFRSIIKKIGRVVVVPFPWNKPDHFHRVWCIWDIYSALKLHNTFHLVLSEREEKSFTNDIKKFGIDSIKKMIAAIDVQNSTGAVQIDVERIHDEIRKEIGFDTLNKLFLRKMQQAFIDIITRIIQQETSSREKGFLLSALSALYLFQGNLIEAEQYCKESIRTLSNDSDLLYERILLGEICISQEKYEEALQIFQNCHDKISKLSNYSVSPRLEDLAELRNPYHLFVQCQRGLVEVLINLGRYENAEIELQSTFDRLQVKADNNYNPLLIGLSNLLIESYEKQGKFELAESLYHHSYRTLSEFHGERHPDTMAALYKLATVYIYRDQLESEKIFRKCLVAQLSILPKDHPETLKTATGLAILLTKMSRFDEAEELFRNVIDSTRSFNHFEALFSYGRCLMEEGKLDEAGPVLTETFDSRKRDLGVDHPNTLIAMKQIVEFHQRRNCQKEACEWYQDYIVLRRASLDRYLPENDHILGIKLSYLERFLTKNYDRRFVATRDIKNIILEETMEYKCSYCEMIRKRNSGDSSVGKATVFVSHYWGNKITQLVTILRHHFSSFETEAERDPYLWIDLFSFNQHITTNFNFFGSIEAIIANINNTVMVFEAWNSPLPLTRAWCIWELYCTIDTNSKFTIAFGGEGEVGVEGGGLDEVLDSIKCEESQCEFERDRVRIYETILRSITFPKLNRLIKEVISSKIK